MLKATRTSQDIDVPWGGVIKPPVNETHSHTHTQTSHLVPLTLFSHHATNAKPRTHTDQLTGMDSKGLLVVHLANTDGLFASSRQAYYLLIVLESI